MTNTQRTIFTVVKDGDRMLFRQGQMQPIDVERITPELLARDSRIELIRNARLFDFGRYEGGEGNTISGFLKWREERCAGGNPLPDLLNELLPEWVGLGRQVRLDCSASSFRAWHRMKPKRWERRS